MWLIVARPMPWRFRGIALPSVLYRTRAGWTTRQAEALRLQNEGYARLERHCVRVPDDYTATVERPTDGS